MDEDSKRSRFNAGVALAERLDMLQKTINMARFNPLLIDMTTQTYNYEVMLNGNDGLLLEAWAKLTEKERKDMEGIRNLAHGFIKTFPIMNNSNDGKVCPILDNYRKFMQILYEYEKKNKIILDEHALNAPNMDDDDEGL